MKQRDWFIILISIICGLSILSIRPFFTKRELTNDTPYYYKIHTEENKSWPEKVIDDPVALFTLILTLSTVGLYLATRSLWNATERLVVGAEKTAEMQLRAYVLFTKGEVVDIEYGKRPTAKLTIKNFGQTPAYKQTQWAAADFDHFPHRADFPVKDKTKLIPQIIGPGQEIEIRADVGRQVFLSNEIGGLVRKSHAIFVVGEIEYTDAFNHLRLTRFTLFSGGPLGKNGDLATYSEGNSAT